MEKFVSGSIKALLFDLGGVLIDIDFDNVFSYWANASQKSLEEIRANFTVDEYYIAHEIGEIEASEYFDSLRNSLGINLSDQQFEEGWNSIFIGEMPGIFELLEPVHKKLPFFGFTNSNDTHKKVWSKKFSRIGGLFQQVFNSSDIGLRKPEPEAFQAVVNAIGYEPHEIIFFDDSLENITGAKNFGLQTVHVKSVNDVESCLNQLLE